MKLALAFALLLISAGISAAHSPLGGTSPSDGESLSVTPTSVALSFKRALRITRVKWSRGDGATGQLELGDYTDFTTEFSLPFEGQGSGTYTIEWRGLSDDGHPQSGTFSFVVD